MLGLAGIPLDVECAFLDPSPAAPASAIGRLVVGALDDREALLDVASGAEVVTYEWEGVPAPAARGLEDAGHRVDPSTAALEVSQDRLAEKTTFRDLGIDVPQFADVPTAGALHAAIDAVGLPAVLKTRRGGYDGKGQVVLRTTSELDAAWDALGASAPLILEQHVPFDRELSILVVRARDGDTRFWPLVENAHRDGILRTSRAPAPGLDPSTQAAAEALVTKLLEQLSYVGVLALELFQVGPRLLANEIAPRVHNSGHWTIEGSTTSQFENHLRAVLGLPLGATDARGVSAMLNCIGELPDPATVLAVDGTHLHLYGKEPRPGRKLGHVTVTAADAEQLESRIAQLAGRAGAVVTHRLG
jgi:5-(carboxyamino)imidazole ribonucleotide synthase